MKMASINSPSSTCTSTTKSDMSDITHNSADPPPIDNQSLQTPLGKPRRVFVQKATPSSADKVKAESGTENGKRSYVPTKDQAHIAFVVGAFSGFAVWFMPNENKTTKTGPHSNKIMQDLVKRDEDFEGIKFEKRSFDLVIDGREIKHPNKDGIECHSRVFVAQGLEDIGDIEDFEAMKPLEGITEVINMEHLATGEKNPIVEVALEKAVVRDITKWADIMSVGQAYQNLLFKFNPTTRSWKMDWTDDSDQSTWGKKNLEVIETYFHKGTLNKLHCVALGLPKEWATPEEQNK
jgi:hypothetical protein